MHEEHGHVAYDDQQVHEHVAVSVAQTVQVEAYSSRLQVTVKVNGKSVCESAGRA